MDTSPEWSSATPSERLGLVLGWTIATIAALAIVVGFMLAVLAAA